MPDDKKPIKKATGCSACDAGGLNVCSCKKGGGGGSGANDGKIPSESGGLTAEIGLTKTDDSLNKPSPTFYSPNQQFIQEGQGNGPVADDRQSSPKSPFSLPRLVPPGSK